MPAFNVEYAGHADQERWDSYVRTHPDATPYHLFGWRDVIHKAYGHTTHYLIATAENYGADLPLGRGETRRRRPGNIVGVLPLVHLDHILFGNDLVSMPFLDSGGMLAACEEVEKSLLSEAIELARRLGARRIELRHERLIASCGDVSAFGNDSRQAPLKVAIRSNKARMLLNLPESSAALLRSFKSKLRSQVMKPVREGLIAKSGRAELLDDFYKVFLTNMRDLGSPVHSVRLMQHMVSEFSECVRIFVVYKATVPVAAALLIGFGNMLRNPWASSLREFSSLSPNMLLYLRMLEFACDSGYRTFDFGRSTRGEGTYKFKEQWGAEPAPLNWTYISLDGKSVDPESPGIERFEAARQCWRRLPLVVTKIIGPCIRKHISL